MTIQAPSLSQSLQQSKIEKLSGKMEKILSWVAEGSCITSRALRVEILLRHFGLPMVGACKSINDIAKNFLISRQAVNKHSQRLREIIQKNKKGKK